LDETDGFWTKIRQFDKKTIYSDGKTAKIRQKSLDTKETSPFELVSLCGTLSNYRTILHDMQEIYDFAVWMEVYE